MKKKYWIHVVNKKTYLYLLTIPVGLVGLLLAYLYSRIDLALFSLIIGFIGIYLFIKDNSYSEWMNPNHPH